MASASLHQHGTWLSLKKLRRRPLNRLPLDEGVSILKPLKGIDPGLRENLATFFALKGEKIELIFSVADPNDPAASLVRELINAHPKIDAKLLVGDERVGMNPKVNNLVRAADHAKYDLILVSDSNTRVPPEYVHELLTQFDENTGVLTAAVAGVSPKGIAAQIESMALNTFYASFMCLAERHGKCFVVGKSMLFRKSQAKRFGGIQNLARYLAEDYMAGEAMNYLGLQVRLQRMPIDQYVGSFSLKAYIDRHIRWGRIRKSQEPLAFAGEVFTGSIISGILGAWALNGLFGVPPALFLAGHFAGWLACDVAASLRVSGKFWFLGWIGRELSVPFLWAASLVGSHVNWRGQRLQIAPGGVLKCTE